MFGSSRWSPSPASWGDHSSTRRGRGRQDRRFRPMGGHEALEPRIALSHPTIDVGDVQPGLNINLISSVRHASSKSYEESIDQDNEDEANDPSLDPELDSIENEDPTESDPNLPNE